MRIRKRRRREYKTDYLNRRKLLQSGKPRVVFRRTNKHIISQYVTSNESQDKVEINVISKDLFGYGWPKEFGFSLKSIPASYLTGYLMGKKIMKDKKETPVVDFGMLIMEHGNKNYAFLKGLIDSGLEIRCKEEAFPKEERIKGKDLKQDFSKYFDKVREQINKV